MKLNRLAAVAAALGAGAVGVVVNAGPAHAATSVEKAGCRLSVGNPVRDSGGGVVATALVRCSASRGVYVQQEMREWDGSWSGSDLIGRKNTGWFTLRANTTYSYKIATSCKGTEVGNEEYYQGARLAIYNYDGNRYSPWAGSSTVSFNC